MGLIDECARLYREYSGYNYIVHLDCNMKLKIALKNEHFYHLAGLHYLTDIAELNKKLRNNSSKNIFKKILRGDIDQSKVEKSKHYNRIRGRLEKFKKFDEVLNCKIIVDFDYTKLPSTKIQSKYILYREYDGIYVMLGLRYDEKGEFLIPETFMVENGDYYVKNQITYEVLKVERDNFTLASIERP